MLDKKKYKRAEVEELLSRQKTEYDETIGELKEKADKLSAENILLSAKVKEFENENEIISSSIKSAQKKATEIIESAENRYLLEVAELKSFVIRFREYFSYLTEKYPHYGKVKDAKTDFDRIADVLSGGATAKKKIAAVNKVVSGASAPFNPQQKIHDYIAGTGENGFNLDEVLNPGELHLEELCKELGLTEEG